MAYSLEEINYRTVTDPKGFVEESDDIYRKKVEKSADLIKHYSLKFIVFTTIFSASTN